MWEGKHSFYLWCIFALMAIWFDVRIFFVMCVLGMFYIVKEC